MLHKTKKGFALLYAIIFITAVSALSVGFFSTIQNFYNREADIQLQSQYIAILKDFPTVIEKKLSTINSEEDLDYFLQNYTNYHFEQKNLKIDISIRPINDKVFFSDMFDSNGNFKADYATILSDVLDFYGLKYKSFFIALLQDAVDTDNSEREPYSEISNKQRDFQDGPIESQEQLKKIIKYYKEETGDESIDSISWDLFFNFYKKPDKYFVDCKLMTPYMYSLMSSYAEEDFYDCKTLESAKSFENFNKSFSIISFNPRSPYTFIVDVNITKNEKQKLGKQFIYESNSRKISFIK
jgi:hypothetical protein